MSAEAPVMHGQRAGEHRRRGRDADPAGRHAPLHRQRGDVLWWPLRDLLQRPRGPHRRVGSARAGEGAGGPADRAADHHHPDRLELHDAVRRVGHSSRRPARHAQLDPPDARPGRHLPDSARSTTTPTGIRDQRRRLRDHLLHAHRLPRRARLRRRGGPDDPAASRSRASSARATTSRSRRSASTGTSWTWCGSRCSQPCTSCADDARSTRRRSKVRRRAMPADTIVGYLIIGAGILFVLGLVFAITSRQTAPGAGLDRPVACTCRSPSLLPFIFSIGAALLGAGLALHSAQRRPVRACRVGPAGDRATRRWVGSGRRVASGTRPSAARTTRRQATDGGPGGEPARAGHAASGSRAPGVARLGATHDPAPAASIPRNLGGAAAHPARAPHRPPDARGRASPADRFRGAGVRPGGPGRQPGALSPTCAVDR